MVFPGESPTSPAIPSVWPEENEEVVRRVVELTRRANRAGVPSILQIQRLNEAEILDADYRTLVTAVLRGKLAIDGEPGISTEERRSANELLDALEEFEETTRKSA